jgi:hypothetical protein
MAQRVLALVEPYGAERLEQACVRALHFGTPEYPTLKRILALGLEAVPVVAAPTPPPANLRFLRHAIAEQAKAGLVVKGVGWRRGPPPMGASAVAEEHHWALTTTAAERDGHGGAARLTHA